MNYHEVYAIGMQASKGQIMCFMSFGKTLRRKLNSGNVPLSY